jgi:hypothetical protein
VSQQVIGISLGLLLIALAFLPDKIETDGSIPIGLNVIKFLAVFVAFAFWINVFWR